MNKVALVALVLVFLVGSQTSFAVPTTGQGTQPGAKKGKTSTDDWLTPCQMAAQNKGNKSKSSKSGKTTGKSGKTTAKSGKGKVGQGAAGSGSKTSSDDWLTPCQMAAQKKGNKSKGSKSGKPTAKSGKGTVGQGAAGSGSKTSSDDWLTPCQMAAQSKGSKAKTSKSTSKISAKSVGKTTKVPGHKPTVENLPGSAH